MNAPRQFLGCVALIVRDYDEAISWYCRRIGFELIEDRRLSETKRWVLIAPPGTPQTRLLLARAALPEQEAIVGRQSGGRVFLFLYTDDFWRDYRTFLDRGVRFVRDPKSEPYGTVAVF